MSRPPTDLPERLLMADATDFERRVLEAAVQKKPSSAASARMARALGVTASAMAGVTVAETAAGAKMVAKKMVAAEATAAEATTVATGATAAWPWVAIGLLGLVVAGATIGAREWRTSPPPAIAPSPPALPPAGAMSQPAAAITEPVPGPADTNRRSRVAAGPGDVREEIALLDAARGALKTGSDRRALEILRRYNDKYPSGSLRPEATAIKVEALVKLGRDVEARALATRFVAEQRGGLLAKRVAEIAGLAPPPRAR